MLSVVPPPVVASKVKSELQKPAPAARIADLAYQAKGGKHRILCQAYMKSLRHFVDLVKDLVSHDTHFIFCLWHYVSYVYDNVSHDSML